MGFFSDPGEDARKANLKKLEDKRVEFARAMEARGFRPEKMLCAQTDNGGFTAVCRFDGKHWLIVSPGFGTDEEFVLEAFDPALVRHEEVRVAAEGMGGILGFGKKGERGVEFRVPREDGEAALPFVYGRNTWAEFSLAKNPLLKTRRRHRDANLVWDFKPVDPTALDRIVAIAEGYFATNP